MGNKTHQGNVPDRARHDRSSSRTNGAHLKPDKKNVETREPVAAAPQCETSEENSLDTRPSFKVLLIGGKFKESTCALWTSHSHYHPK